MNKTSKDLLSVDLKKAANMLNGGDFEEMIKLLKCIRSLYPNNYPSVTFHKYKGQSGLIAIFDIDGYEVGKIQLIADGNKGLFNDKTYRE